MHGKVLVMTLSLVALPAAAQAQHAPDALIGKSIVVNWSEDRSLRRAEETAFRETRTPFTVSIYVSTKGQPFTRITAMPPKMSGKGNATGSADYLGRTGAEQGGGVRLLGFKGNSLELTTTMRAGGARHLVVQFDSGFTSCSASIIAAKQVGSAVIHTRSIASGAPIEIRSVTASGATCAVRNGNVLAE